MLEYFWTVTCHGADSDSVAPLWTGCDVLSLSVCECLCVSMCVVRREGEGAVLL